MTVERECVCVCVRERVRHKEREPAQQRVMACPRSDTQGPMAGDRGWMSGAVDMEEPEPKRQA